MTRLLLLLFAVIFGNLSAGVIDHLKIPIDKLGNHKMRNIDFIYMLNLDQRPEKYEKSLKELAPFGIVPYRFSAVNGWELTHEDINDVGIKYELWMKQELWGTCYLLEDNGEWHLEIIHVPGRNYFCHCMSKGAIGIALSHLSILKDAYDSGYETIWVMEDDIGVIKDPHLLSELIDKLDTLVGKNGWDFLFTDFDTKNNNGAYVPCTAYALRANYDPPNPYRCMERIDVSQDFRKIGARYGAYSMIVRRSGMKKMLDFMMGGIFLPYDMEYTMPANINMFTVRDDVVSTIPNSFSDNSLPTYTHKKKE